MPWALSSASPSRPTSDQGSRAQPVLDASMASATEVTSAVRCLVRADGGVPDSEDEPGLVAVVGRAY